MKTELLAGTSPDGMNVLDIHELARMTKEAICKHTDALEEQTRYAERKAAELEEENKRLCSEMEWVKKNWPGREERLIPDESAEAEAEAVIR